MFTIHFVSHLVCSSVLTSLSPQMLVCFCCRKGRNFSLYTKLCELITWDPHVGFQFYVLEPTGFYSANSWVPRVCLIILRVEDKRSDKCIIHSCGWHKHFPPWRNWYSGEHAVNRLSISEVSTFADMEGEGNIWFVTSWLCPRSGRESLFATEAATTILRIDDVIKLMKDESQNDEW